MRDLSCLSHSCTPGFLRMLTWGQWLSPWRLILQAIVLAVRPKLWNRPNIYHDFFFYFDFNHDFDTNRHALSYTSYLFLHILFCPFLYSITHFISFFLHTHIYIYALVWCYFVYNFYSLHCPLSGPDLIYISLLIIPCIIYHVTNKETLTFTVINAFCVNLKHFQRKPIRPFPKSCNMSLEQTNSKIYTHTHIYIYIYIYICE